MSPLKQSVMKLVEDLPDDCTLEDIQYRLYVLAKIEAGETAIHEGRVISQDEAERRMGAFFAACQKAP